MRKKPDHLIMTEFKPIKEGKVREIYDNGDSLIMVATDRISAFDVILKNKVTKEHRAHPDEQVLVRLHPRSAAQPHAERGCAGDMPEFFRQPQFTGNSMMCRKLTMLPIECIVRGYITGSGWAKLPEDRQGVRHPAARGPAGVR